MPKETTSSLDTSRMRQHNLAAVLEIVHKSRGVTRAQITRELELNRSTIGDLVSQLSESGWVVELWDETRTGVGRPSPLVTAANQWLVAAINPEVDAVEIALASLGGEIVDRKRVEVDQPTASEVASIVANEVSAMEESQTGSKVIAAGIAVPGLVRTSDGVVRLAPGLGWKDQPLAELVSEALGVPALAANDAHLGSRAELSFGAGQGADSIIYLNGGPSGIGGGIVIAGNPVGGFAGYAGEVGHISVNPEGEVCACGATGCLESIVRRADLVARLGLSHPDDDQLDAAVLNAVGQADGKELRSWVDQQLTWLSIALRSVVNLLNPERVVLGGYLASIWKGASEAQRTKALDQALSVSAEGVEITVAALESQRLLVGAAELAWDDVMANPIESLKSVT